MSENEKMISGASSQDAGMADEAADGWLDQQTLAGMAADPAMQNMISTLQEDACATFSAIVDKTAAALMQGIAPSPVATRGSGPLTAQQAARLAVGSKQRGQAWQEARELAEMLVVGAMINKNNPDWDPADPSTCMKMGQEGSLLSLMQFDLDGAAAQESLNA